MSSFVGQLEVARKKGEPVLMGVLNVTPDSFYDGSRFSKAALAEQRIDELIAAGADIIDIGAESSRPRAEPVDATEQLRRIGGCISYAVARGATVSVDTTSSEVADAVLQQGATLINDVSCLHDESLAKAVADHGAFLVITHSLAPMSAMKDFSEWPEDHYGDIVREVALLWGQARQRAVELGVNSEQIVFDPGLGFSKSARHSFQILRRLREFKMLNAPILVGPGRKSFIAAVDPSTAEQRLGGTIAASIAAVLNGADILRVHDVFEVRQALRVVEGIRHPFNVERTQQEAPPANPCQRQDYPLQDAEGAD